MEEPTTLYKTRLIQNIILNLVFLFYTKFLQEVNPSEFVRAPSVLADLALMKVKICYVEITVSMIHSMVDFDCKQE